MINGKELQALIDEQWERVSRGTYFEMRTGKALNPRGAGFDFGTEFAILG